MDICEKNKFNIDKRISLGLNLIRKNYELKEIIIGEFQHLNIKGMNYKIKQYEIKGVGNLLVMESKDSKVFQMDTFVITPYYKNLPLFSSDYIYNNDKRTFLNEIYSLTDNEDDLYNKYIRKFADMKNKCSHLTDMKVKSCWYDDIRPVCIAKNTDYKNDDEIISIFIKNLEIFINMEKESPLLNEDQYKIKWQKTQDYTDGLVDDGGVSTDVFKVALGAQKTKDFFNKVFFAPSLYKK